MKINFTGRLYKTNEKQLHWFNIWTDLSSWFSYQTKELTIFNLLFKHIKIKMLKCSHHIRLMWNLTSKFRQRKIQLSFPCRIPENVDGTLNSHISQNSYKTWTYKLYMNEFKLITNFYHWLWKGLPSWDSYINCLSFVSI